jgi:Kef-type K+ transport system membrane component KefB
MAVLFWIIALIGAFLIGQLMRTIRMPAILGWLIAGMIFGPYGVKLITHSLMQTHYYTIISNWMQVSFGLILGTELIWNKLKTYGKALVTTTLTQSLGTFLIVSMAFAVVFYFAHIPVWLGFVFGSIALATAPAPALSIVQEFKTKGPVTDTLLPMAVLDDVVGIIVFFTVNAFVTKIMSNGSFSWILIPIMILLPIGIGIIPGYIIGRLLKKHQDKKSVMALLLIGVTVTQILCYVIYSNFFKNLSPNYMMAGVAFSAVFSNMIKEEDLNTLTNDYAPVLTLSLLISIVNLGAPLDYHLILGAGIYTAIYIIFRACGKYFGARFGATITHMPVTVRKYLGLTLLPHSGVSLVFTGIACTSLASQPSYVKIVQGTIAAAAVINEIIAVIVAKKGFELSGEISAK